MEVLDASSRQSVGLPSINHLDPVKREDADYHRKQSTAAMATPLHPFAGPSHLHINHQSSPASAVPGSLGGLLSPPESRRTSGDEKESQRPTARQSLPSIHEALGAEQSLAYPAPAPVPPPSASAPQHYHPSSAVTSPSDQRQRTFSTDAHGSQGPANPFSHPRSPYVGASTSQVPPPPQTHAESLHRSSFSSPRPPYSTPQHNPKLPTLHPLKTTQSPPTSAARPPNAPYSYPPPSSTYEAPAPPPSASMSHYSYPHYPPNYPLSAPPQSAQNPAYPPSSTTYSAPPRYPPSSWRDGGEMARLEEKKINRSSLAGYGESVKRHLESFDLEASLNEMADGSGRIAEFSKTYRLRAYDNQRIGMTPQSMPKLEEVDDMLKQSERIQISLQRMRDVVFNNHQTILVEASHHRPGNGYDHDSSSNYGDDPKNGGGFAGGDSKIRKRGRAAPPGRCHSCNRAETPEWRRGPDGARTLCNACGLHYAKLTRKMGGKAMASSNLRPKSLDHGSPI
ncbi:hypothetical protein DE146DRAFT_637371 [Phaeosphaeria sp. MPI-PUGE-AT-0046c]|nr:hypothetical protein DE146DRAFT_637371 [Phaeosphaeria sp. MPI-PUGE-AT-0046c]